MPSDAIHELKLDIIDSAKEKIREEITNIESRDDLSDDEKRLFTRQMEVFAGFAERGQHFASCVMALLAEGART